MSFASAAKSASVYFPESRSELIFPVSRLTLLVLVSASCTTNATPFQVVRPGRIFRRAGEELGLAAQDPRRVVGHDRAGHVTHERGAATERGDVLGRIARP